MQQFYYCVDGQSSVGPHNLNEIQELYADGFLKADTHICKIGENAWKLVKDFPEIQSVDLGKRTTYIPIQQQLAPPESNQQVVVQTPEEPKANGSPVNVAKIILTISFESSASAPQVKVEVAK